MLFDHIISRGSYSEADAANIVKQILEAVSYMHANGIAHRDLKPENLLCTGKDNQIIKVTDFGLSKSFGESKLVTACGTPGNILSFSQSLDLSVSFLLLLLCLEYAAPEVVTGAGNYDNAVDIWAVGVITYILCVSNLNSLSLHILHTSIPPAHTTLAFLVFKHTFLCVHV
jgi:calcium/calmodulin-dependent protein kinase I